MDPSEKDESGTVVDDPDDATDDDLESAGEEKEKKEKLSQAVEIEAPSACERHVTVTISEADVQRYLDKEYTELMPKAQVPGFRPGRAPRKLVEARFRKDIQEKIKGELLMDSIAQINEEHEMAAISEPDLDLDAIEVPSDGPMTFEFNLEVRPEFDMPQWKGLRLKRPVHEFTREDVDRQLTRILSRDAGVVPFDGPAELGDYVTCNLKFRDEDRVLSEAKEEVIRIRPVLTFRDGKIDHFGELIAGVRSGETRTTQLTLADNARNEALRGKEITAEFHVLEVKRLELPEMTPELLAEIGEFDDEGELRDAVKANLERRLDYHQKQEVRKQITALLTESANWELPPDLLRRQSDRELERSVMELQRSGFSIPEIRAHANQLRQNSQATTAVSLKEHFILERIAEAEEIDATDADFDEEIALIALQSDESPRRVRAKLEKRGVMDVLQNQIIERKVVDLVRSHATFEDVPYETGDEPQEEALDRSAGGSERESDIPEAKPGGQQEELAEPKDHT